MFSVHRDTKSQRFWKASFPIRISVDGRPNPQKRDAFSNFSDVWWTELKSAINSAKSSGTFKTGANGSEVSLISKKCLVLETRPIQPNISVIPWGKSKERNFPVRNFWKFGYILGEVILFSGDIKRYRSHLLLKNFPAIQTGMVEQQWPNRKRPKISIQRNQRNLGMNLNEKLVNVVYIISFTSYTLFKLCGKRAWLLYH